MSDILQTACSALQAVRHGSLSQTVTYRRGEATIEIAATIGRTIFEVDDGQGVIVQVESRDWLVRVSDLVLGWPGVATEPKPGDRVEATSGATVRVYEVTAMAGEKCWRYSDPYRETFRIHTKQLDTREA